MKKTLLLAILVLGVLIAMTYVSCNNATTDGAARKPDTVVVKADSSAVKEIKK